MRQTHSSLQLRAILKSAIGLMCRPPQVTPLNPVFLHNMTFICHSDLFLHFVGKCQWDQAPDSARELQERQNWMEHQKLSWNKLHPGAMHVWNWKCFMLTVYYPFTSDFWTQHFQIWHWVCVLLFVFVIYMADTQDRPKSYSMGCCRNFGNLFLQSVIV